jgi:hypothetical protein
MLDHRIIISFIPGLFLLFFGRIVPCGALSTDTMQMLGIGAGAVVMW